MSAKNVDTTASHHVYTRGPGWDSLSIAHIAHKACSVGKVEGMCWADVENCSASNCRVQCEALQDDKTTTNALRDKNLNGLQYGWAQYEACVAATL
eukprot:2063610-Amphidinium_carterae.3